MGYLFSQVWFLCLLSFLVGSLLTYVFIRATRRPTVEVTEERFSGPVLTDRSGSHMSMSTRGPNGSGASAGAGLAAGAAAGAAVADSDKARMAADEMAARAENAQRDAAARGSAARGSAVPGSAANANGLGDASAAGGVSSASSGAMAAGMLDDAASKADQGSGDLRGWVGGKDSGGPAAPGAAVTGAAAAGAAAAAAGAAARGTTRDAGSTDVGSEAPRATGTASVPAAGAAAGSASLLPPKPSGPAAGAVAGGTGNAAGNATGMGAAGVGAAGAAVAGATAGAAAGPVEDRGGVLGAGPWPGSAAARADGSAPSHEYRVKARIGSMQYLTSNSPDFESVKADLWFRSQTEAELAGFREWTSVRRDEGADKAGMTSAAGSAKRMVEAGPYPGSVHSAADGSSPSQEYQVKGNAQSMLYHTKDSPSYRETKAEYWFKTTADAERAGFTSWNRRDARHQA